jgi:peptidoglycan/LPS O-acetylase OafA/YrhL
MRWNRLLGMLVAALGITQLIRATLDYFLSDYATPVSAPYWYYTDIVPNALAIVALLLSYSLIRGHDWARRILVAIVCCCGVAIIVSAAVPDRGHWDYFRLASALAGLPWLLVVCFTIFILLHPDVRRDFHRDESKSSNQALQPTAGRSDA